MKIRIHHLDFSKDPTFRTDLCDPYYMIAQTKRHWWSRWHYVMDETSRYPKLFKTKAEILNHFHYQVNSIFQTLIPDNETDNR